MALFNYSARNREGQQINDAIESSSLDAAVLALRAQGLLVLQISEIKKNTNDLKTFSLNPFEYRSLRDADIEVAFHQIAVMLRSGLSLLDALEITHNHSRIGCRKTWKQIIERIQQGSSFSEALKEHKIFSMFTLQLIYIGEQTGHLSVVTDQAAEEIKSSRRIKKQVVSALRYPAFTLLFAIGLVVFMLTSIVPEIKKLLLIMGKPMPPMTQALIDISDWFSANIILLGIGAFISVVSFIILYNVEISRWWIDKHSLKLPLLGHVFRLSGTVLFSRAMGLLLRSGVVMVEALKTMEKLHVNKYMAGRIAFSHRKILQGSGLGESLSVESAYMPLLLQMVHVGENSGTLDEILLEMTEYHDDLLQKAIATLTGMIAPIMTVFVGGIVGFVYAAFLVAMFSAAGGSPS